MDFKAQELHKGQEFIRHYRGTLGDIYLTVESEPRTEDGKLVLIVSDRGGNLYVERLAPDTLVTNYGHQHEASGWYCRGCAKPAIHAEDVAAFAAVAL